MKRCVASLAALLALAAAPALAAPVETFVEAPGPAGALKGTMLTPQGGAKPPLVLIIPGAGPTDRNGDSPLGVRGGYLQDLAEALAERGIASVRVDKRGTFASAAAGDANKTTIGGFAQDVTSWVASIRKTTGARCIWLAGHSEGALVAQIAAEKATDVCGLVLIAGPGRRIGEVMRSQFASNPAIASYLPALNKAVDELEAGRTVDTSNLPPQLAGVMFSPPAQTYIIDWMRRDPVALLKAYKGPVLVLQGDNDIQVLVEDADRLAAARPGVKKVVLKDVNHVLRIAPRDRAGNAAAYADPSLPLAPGVADAVADFVKAH